MQNFNPKIYCFINSYNLSDLSKLSNNINIIYRNYEKLNDYETILKLKSFCNKTKRRFYISNNIKLALNLKVDGVYVPSFNKKINYCCLYRIPKKFEIIGSAHNFKEIITKEKQGCDEIFISPIFKVQKTKKYLGIIKFNFLTNLTNKRIIALGGINQKNYRKLKSTKMNGFASISWAKKNGLRKLRPFLKLNNS